VFQHFLAELEAALRVVHELQKRFIRKLTKCLLEVLSAIREAEAANGQSQIPQ
jgi:hypothetical protein